MSWLIAIGDLLPSITTPAQIVASANDAFVPWSNNQYLPDLLPNNEIHPPRPGSLRLGGSIGGVAARSPTGSTAGTGA